MSIVGYSLPERSRKCGTEVCSSLIGGGREYLIQNE